jgi:hypothetical protein
MLFHHDELQNIMKLFKMTNRIQQYRTLLLTLNLFAYAKTRIFGCGE